MERIQTGVRRRLGLLRGRRGNWRTLIVGLVLLLLIVATLAVVGAVLSRTGQQDDASRAVAGSGRLLGVTPTIDVMLDAATLANGQRTEDQWPALLEQSTQATVNTQSLTSASFIPVKKGAPTFTTSAADIEADANVVILVSGGDEGGASPIAVLSAATRTIAAVRGTAPTARIVLVGPLGPVSSPATLSSLLQNAAAVGGATWIDPSGWLRGEAGLRRDGELTIKGEERIASRFKVALAPLLR